MRTVHFRCDLSEAIPPLPHFWEHTVGSCHAPMALRADWQSQLRRCHDELGFRHVRFHGLLSDDVGTLIRHSETLLYSFFNADQIVDFLVSNGMRPFVELSFMPVALASGSKTVFRYGANVTPPRDYKQWAALIRKLAAHWVARYGVEEVRNWFFEVWNEPNLKAFWTGTRQDYFTLYRYTVEAIKDVDEHLRVGGPATAKNEWIEEFLDFCVSGRNCPSISSARTITRPMRWEMKTRIRRHSWRTAGAASSASRPRTPGAGPGGDRFITRSGTPRPTRATRGTTSPTLPPSSSRR